jgi:hypothetical protein
MASLISLAVLLEAAALVSSTPLARPTVTPPVRVKRDFQIANTDAYWTGWYTTTGTDGSSTITSSAAADDYAMVTSGTLVYQCETSATDWESSCSTSFATTCSGTTAYFLDGSSSDCSGACNADTIYTTNTAEPNQGLQWWGCTGRDAQFFFEVEPEAVTTTSSTSSPTPSATASPGHSPSPSHSPTPSATPSPSSTPSPAPAPSKSKAWIAGPAIGGVAALGLAGFLIFFLRRRKQKKPASETTAYQPAPQMLQQSPHPYQSPSMGAPSPNLPPYGDHAGYYGHVVEEGKPATASVYAHAPAEGTMQMPVGVSEYHDGRAGSFVEHRQEGSRLSELPAEAPVRGPAELGDAEHRR